MACPSAAATRTAGGIIRPEHYHAFARALPRTSMTDQSRDPESTASTVAEQAGARRKSRRGNASGKLATLLRRCEGNRRQEYKKEDSTSDIRSTEHRFKGPSSSKLSFLDFVCNVKKHLLLKNLCKSKKKVGFFSLLYFVKIGSFFLSSFPSFFVRSEISSLLFFRDGPCSSRETCVLSEIIISLIVLFQNKETETTSPCSGTKQNNVISVIQSLNSYHKQELSNDEQALSDRRFLYEARLSDVFENSFYGIEENVANISMQYGTPGTNSRTVPTRQQDKSISDSATVSKATVMQSIYSDATVAVSNAIADVPGSVHETLNNENKVKASLAKELLNLSKYGWYWGPISGDEADAKLISEPDGAFLVRDSSDDRCTY